MPIETELSSILDIEKALKYDPPQSLDPAIVDKLTLPLDWIVQLKYSDSLLKKHLDQHIGIGSSYKYKMQLIDTLKIIFFRLGGQLDPQLGKASDSIRAVIYSKLTDDIALCTAGFHNRCNEIIQSFGIPQSFTQLLHIARESLVVKAAVKLLNNDVHFQNTVFSVANTAGFGVRARNTDDIHPGAVDDNTILKALTSTFKEEYTPINLTLLLIDQLNTIVLESGITNDAKTGFDSRDMKKLHALLEGYLKDHTPLIASCFLQKEYEEDGIPLTRFFAINWKTIAHHIFEKLCTDRYFKIQQTITSLRQLELLSNYFSDMTIFFVSQEILIGDAFISSLDKKNEWDALKKVEHLIIDPTIRAKLLHMAIDQDNVDAITWLRKDTDLLNALKEVEHLIIHPTKIHAKLLHMAIDQDNVDVINWLIARKDIDLSVTASNGEMIVQGLARKKMWPQLDKITEYVTDNRSDGMILSSTLLFVCYYMYANKYDDVGEKALREIALKLIEKKPSTLWAFSAGDYAGYAALHFAVLGGDLSLVKTILKSNPTVIYAYPDSVFLALMIAQNKTSQNKEEMIGFIFGCLWLDCNSENIMRLISQKPEHGQIYINKLCDQYDDVNHKGDKKIIRKFLQALLDALPPTLDNGTVTLNRETLTRAGKLLAFNKRTSFFACTDELPGGFQKHEAALPKNQHDETIGSDSPCSGDNLPHQIIFVETRPC
ncbi:MAG: hypothetical protein A3F13_09355 [Gammaproteobacteria bacterium RIFCSPHIGHO2_12_FULL_40_19]|nr:MAG: hypothetical protein A3F13_09355 [Gammaproteobacteria bacterium RIFCSPHIGHO2_12_FULL_40_19]